MDNHLTELEAVTLYVNNNIYHSDAFDKADEIKRFKAINNAKRQLTANLPNKYENGIPTEDVAEQTIWLMRINDLMLNAEQGAKSISLDGISISFSETTRTIAPAILQKYGISGKGIKKIGRYKVNQYDTFRKGCKDSCTPF